MPAMTTSIIKPMMALIGCALIALPARGQGHGLRTFDRWFSGPVAKPGTTERTSGALIRTKI